MELARIAETSPAVTDQFDVGTKPADASAPTACSIVMFADSGPRSWAYLDCVLDQVGFSAPAIVEVSDSTLPGSSGPEGLVARGFPAAAAAGATA